MTQTDQDANLGRIAKRYADARKRLALCQEEIKFRAHLFHRLWETFDQDSIPKILNYGETLIASLKRESFDWSKLTQDSLSDLLAELCKAEAGEKEARQAKTDAGV